MVVINKNLPKGSKYNVKQHIVNLEPVRFDALIEGQGVRVFTYSTLICPNIKKIDTGEHEIDCRLCNGTNFIDRSPIESWAFIQNQSLNRSFNTDGTFDDQTVSATFQIGTELQYFAKVELRDFTTNYYELIQRGEGDIDRLKYAAFKINHVIDKHGNEYESPKSFGLSGGDIKWIGNNKPAMGTIYSIHYAYPITYRACNAMHINRFGQFGFKTKTKTAEEYPQQWMLKRDYLITREDIQGNPLYFNKPIIEI